MTRVKICGITNLDDALAAARFGADELGFNFFEGSPRYITPGSARSIIEMLNDSVATVGVFVNESFDKVERIRRESLIGAVQFHGDESPEFVERFCELTGMRVIKAVRISSEYGTAGINDYDVDALLLDSYSANERGGTGKTFDWGLAREITRLTNKIYLAGGLTPENVSEAVKTVRPYAVDVCSGVEAARGTKDHKKLRHFIERAKEYG